MEKCIICQKETNEVNASNQPVHIVCMEGYHQSVLKSIKTLQSELGSNWNMPDGGISDEDVF